MKLKRIKLSKVLKILSIFCLFIFITLVAIKGTLFIITPPNYTEGPQKSIAIDHPLSSQMYFNNTVGQKGILEIPKKQIEEAQHSIEIAMYSFNSRELKEALYKADKRGVNITLVLDKGNKAQHDLFFSDLPPTITRIDTGRYDISNSKNTTHMHHKFMIIDREYETKELFTGSLNFTDLGEKFNQSFAITTKDPSVIQVYASEFDLLKKDISGVTKLKNKSYNPWAATIQYTDSFVEIWFSPGLSEQSLKYRILEQITSAQESIDIIMWDLTDEQISKELIKKAKEGVRVRIITEDIRTKNVFSSIPYLQKIKQDEDISTMEIILDTKLNDHSVSPIPQNFSAYIHQHSMIVDKKILTVGSGNWSLWGFYNNDEDALITNNTYLIEESLKTFDYFYNILK